MELAVGYVRLVGRDKPGRMTTEFYQLLDSLDHPAMMDNPQKQAAALEFFCKKYDIDVGFKLIQSEEAVMESDIARMSSG